MSSTSALKSKEVTLYVDVENGTETQQEMLYFLNGYGDVPFVCLNNAKSLMGLILGTLVCLITQSESQNVVVLAFKQIAKFYVLLFRGTPVVVQLLIIYFILFASYSGDSVYVAMLAFGLNSGAYVSEIIRGGINAVPLGQYQAGLSLGLSYRSMMQKIILPQAYKNAFPSLCNEVIALIKETSVAGFIGTLDLTLAFRKIANATYDFLTVYLVMGLVYFVIVMRRGYEI